jgi:hypothetical protein
MTTGSDRGINDGTRDADILTRERRVRKIIPGIFCLLAFSFWRAGAETVTIYVSADVKTQATAAVASFLTDGLMDVLFEEGHVAFDGTFALATYEEFRAPGFRLSAARADEADLAVLVYMNFLDPSSVFPARIFYELVDVFLGKKLAEGEATDAVGANNPAVAATEISSIGARGTNLGKTIANEVVGKIAR